MSLPPSVGAHGAAYLMSWIDAMFTALNRAERSFLILAVAALVGWISFAYFAWSSRSLSHQINTLAAEHREALAKYKAIQSTAGELSQLETQLSASRMEYSRVAQAERETKAKAIAAQQELATLTKRVEQARDSASQTGSIRPADPTRRAPR